MALTWNPEQYGRFAGARGRPFFDLVGRIDIDAPRAVVDLGCGPGDLTATLCSRWPGAQVIGVDSSAEMIQRAAARPAVPGLTFRLGEIEQWRPPGDTDVLVSNAALQWVPRHRELLTDWAQTLSSGAWLAFQVPGNFGSPSHTLMRELAESPRWRTRLEGVLRHEHAVDDAATYARMLLDLGWSVDSWETTYLHVLPGSDPVLEWVRGTGLRPILQALDPAETIEFEAEYAALLRSAYPGSAGGTVFPFRRIFVVAHQP